MVLGRLCARPVWFRLVRVGIQFLERLLKLDYLNTVRTFVIDNFLFGDDDGLQDNTSFLVSNIIDSTGILELIMFLEEEFDISIEDDETIPEKLYANISLNFIMHLRFPIHSELVT